MSGTPVSTLDPAGAFQALFERGVSGVAQTDAHGRLLLVSSRLCAMLGYSQAELLGLKLSDLVAPSDRAGHVAVLQRVADEGGGALTSQYQRKDGSTLWGLTHLTAVGAPPGSADTLVVIVHDVSEHQPSQHDGEVLGDRHQRLVRELRDADRRKDDFIALLAHELRNPLAPLRNALAVMKLAGSDASSAARAREIMERQLSHLVRLIEDLLDVSRIGLNKMQLRRAPVWLSDVLSSAIETARPAIDAAGHELEVSIPSEPALLDADLTRLAQVFGNLLTNAAKYTPKHGRIALRAEISAETVVVTVEDNGIGLQPDSLRSIFGLFSQVDSGLERATGGLGIGLALVRGLTEMHGGTVRAESAGAGRGSRFVVSLPLAAAKVLEPGRAAAPRPPTHRPRRRILVADDNRDAAESLATMLRMSGDEVHVAHDGIEAFERTEALKPDVVVMDVGMPRLNGHDATRRIRAQSWGRDVLVIALTGWSQESDRRISHEAGCDAHLVKPVDVEQLKELIEELCDRTSGSRPIAADEAAADSVKTG